VHLYHIFLIHLSVVGQLSCFQSLAIMYKAVIIMDVQEVIFYPGAYSFWYMPGSDVTVSYGSPTCSFLRSLHIAFHNGCTNLHSHQQCRSVPFSPHLQQNFLLFMLLIQPFWLGWDGMSMSFWFAFLLWP
jgi:hypothetical protein